MEDVLVGPGPKLSSNQRGQKRNDDMILDTWHERGTVHYSLTNGTMGPDKNMSILDEIGGFRHDSWIKMTTKNRSLNLNHDLKCSMTN